ncbi:MAG: TVP38/TMEM64 family protein [Rhizobiaceae bacterium]|nr:TVP38/TMEM64 family protein [Hyphomicrobiales bacterium]NRB32020.1 TVP38/TMEM64 family protein [Rhizobiaceae bacterium]
MSNVTMSAEQASRSNGHMKWIILAALIAIFAAAYIYLPISEWLTAFQDWVQGFGALGWAIFIAVYAITSFVLIPGSILTLGAGVAYGLWAFPLVVAGAVLASAMSFLAARYVFHDRVQEKVAQYPRFKAVNEAIRDEGWKVVLLLRLSPALPFSLQNWFLGLMPVGFWPAQIATLFGIMPGTLLYIWVASLGGEAAAGGAADASLLRYAVLGIGLLATLVVTIVVTRKAQQKLKEFAVD